MILRTSRSAAASGLLLPAGVDRHNLPDIMAAAPAAAIKKLHIPAA